MRRRLLLLTWEKAFWITLVPFYFLFWSLCFPEIGCFWLTEHRQVRSYGDHFYSSPHAKPRVSSLLFSSFLSFSWGLWVCLRGCGLESEVLCFESQSPPHRSWGTLDTSLHLIEPQFPAPENEGNKGKMWRSKALSWKALCQHDCSFHYH